MSSDFWMSGASTRMARGNSSMKARRNITTSVALAPGPQSLLQRHGLVAHTG